MSETSVVRLVAASTGGVLTACAALAADLARAHMSSLGALCGVDAHPHCGWCYGAAGFALAALYALGLAVRGQFRLAARTARHTQISKC